MTVDIRALIFDLLINLTENVICSYSSILAQGLGKVFSKPVDVISTPKATSENQINERLGCNQEEVKFA